MNDTRHLSAFRFLIAGVVLVGLVVATVALFTNTVPDSNRENVSLVVGGLLTLSGTVVNWAFGSSSGAQRANDRTEKVTDALIAASPSVPVDPKAEGEVD